MKSNKRKQVQQVEGNQKVLVLFSGGLDSRLAVKLLQEQGLDVEGIHFILPFGEGCCNTSCSFNFSQKQDFPLKMIDCSKGKLLQEYLDIIRHPKYGRGSGLNPCIDCRIFLVKKAKEYADKNKIEIIATGEVLNERPMSQHNKALKIIEEEAGVKGRLLRPLSAKLLEETDAERKGIVDREKLLDISGRQRNKQIELAKKYKINYPQPAGGCLLCEKSLKDRIQCLLNQDKIGEQEVRLLSVGRHFPGIILGRNEKENIILEGCKGIVIIPVEPGPSALVFDKKNIDKAKELIQKYSKHKIERFEVKNV